MSPLLHILRAPDAEGLRVEDDVDESLLMKTEGVLDTEHERTTWVEYRFIGDDTIVHRSVHVQLKRWPDGVGADAGRFG